MARHRSHSVEFKRQVALEFLAGETLHGLAKRHDISRNLIRIWVEKYEAGAFEDDARAADLIQAYEARIAALERLVGKQVTQYLSEALDKEIKYDPCTPEEFGRYLYVNNGFGFLGFPGRVGIYPEITSFELKKKKA